MLVALKVDRSVAAAIALAILVATFMLWRLSERRKAEEADRNRRDQEWRNRPLQAGFRGLSSYTRLDELPGKTRQQLARRIALTVAHPTFRYGLVSGEVGAGKSSLLDSGVAKELESADFSIVFVRGLQDASDRALPAVITALRSKLDEFEQPVLILDQFEEMLIEWRTQAVRQKLGAFLSKPLPDKLVRVLCSVRADYIIAMYDLAPALSDPTSSNTLNPVKNLDQKEAAEIIVECAMQDRMNIDRGLATQIAADLSHGGQVRPPELQLVCLALQSDSPEKVYRERGGAEGILSAHVKDVVNNSRDPSIARLALRAMCNFEAMPPAKRQPQPLAHLAEAIGQHRVSGAGTAKLKDVLRHLTRAGLVRELGAGHEITYALIHDYLVQSVARATSDASTEAERATQLLRLHLTEYSADRSSRIPLRRLRLIQRHADRELLASAPACALMRRSYWVAGRRSAAALSGVALLILTILSLPGMVAHWPERTQRPIATHHPRGFPEFVMYQPSSDGRLMMAIARLRDESDYISLWDIPTGRQLAQVAGRQGELAAGTVAYIHVPPDSPPNRIGDVMVMRREPARADAPLRPMRTGLRAKAGDGIGLNSTGTALLVVNAGADDDSDDRLSIWDVRRRRTIATLTQPGLAGAVLDGSGRIAVVGSRLWRVGSSASDAFVQFRSPNAGEPFTIDPAGQTLAIGRRTGENSGTIRTWNLARRELIARRTLAPYPEFMRIDFTADGRHILIGDYNPSNSFDPLLLRVSDAALVARLPSRRGDSLRFGRRNGTQLETTHLVWRNPRGGVFIWNAERGVIRSARPGIERLAYAEASPDSRHIAIIRKDGRIELWETARWRMVATPTLPGFAQRAHFINGGAMLSIALAGGSYSLIEVPSGKLVATFYDLGGVTIAHYDSSCLRAHFWTNEGFLYHYAMGRHWPIGGFRPILDCASTGPSSR